MTGQVTIFSMCELLHPKQRADEEKWDESQAFEMPLYKPFYDLDPICYRNGFWNI